MMSSKSIMIIAIAMLVQLSFFTPQNSSSFFALAKNNDSRGDDSIHKQNKRINEQTRKRNKDDDDDDKDKGSRRRRQPRARNRPPVEYKLEDKWKKKNRGKNNEGNKVADKEEEIEKSNREKKKKKQKKDTSDTKDKKSEGHKKKKKKDESKPKPLGLIPMPYTRPAPLYERPPMLIPKPYYTRPAPYTPIFRPPTPRAPISEPRPNPDLPNMAIINDNPFIPPPTAPTSVLRAPEPAPIPVPGVPGGLPFCCFKNAAHKSCPTKSPTSAPTISPTKSPTSIPTISPTKSPTSAPTMPFKCVMSVGTLTEYWWNIQGLTIASLISETNNFQKPPDMIVNNSAFLEVPPNRKDPITNLDVDNYGVRLKGFIVPPKNGTYTFWIASDDQGQFSLSTTSFRKDLVKMCEVFLWVSSTTEYDKYPEQKSKPIDLVANELYYYEALMKEGPLEDYLSIGWQIPGEARTMVPGQFLKYCNDPNFDYGP